MHLKKFIYSAVAFLLVLGLYLLSSHVPRDLLSSLLSGGIYGGSQTAQNMPKARHYLVPILLFHNLDGKGEYSISRFEFRSYIEEIRDSGVQVVPLHTLYEHARENRFFERPTVVITIDDDYTNAVRIGAPILREFRFPATFFVYIHDINSHPHGGLSWEDLDRLRGEGLFEIQNHSWSHSAFHIPRPGETPAHYQKRLQRETVLSRDALERNLAGDKIYAFAFPMGYRTEELQQKLFHEGYKLLLTTDAHAVNLSKPFTGIFDRYTIQKGNVNVQERMFRHQLQLARRTWGAVASGEGHSSARLP